MALAVVVPGLPVKVEPALRRRRECAGGFDQKRAVSLDPEVRPLVRGEGSLPVSVTGDQPATTNFDAFTEGQSAMAGDFHRVAAVAGEAMLVLLLLLLLLLLPFKGDPY